MKPRIRSSRARRHRCHSHKVAGEGTCFVAVVVPAMTFGIQQAPMHRAMDEVFGEGAHHDGGNRGADKSDHVEHAIVPWFKCWVSHKCAVLDSLDTVHQMHQSEPTKRATMLWCAGC